MSSVASQVVSTDKLPLSIRFTKSSYTHIVKPLCFLFDAETIHNSFIGFGVFLGKWSITRKLFQKTYVYHNNQLAVHIFNTTFANPVGLAAGFDYEGKLSRILPTIGFSFESIGTITNNASEGNPKPRLQRLVKSKSILVNKGFKNSGIRNILHNNVNQEAFQNKDFNIGISVGATNQSNTVTSKKQIADIIESLVFLKAHPLANKFTYYEINISCPNVAGSGALSAPTELDDLFSKIKKLQLKKPLAVKLPIELPWEKTKQLINTLIRYHVEAIIVGNLAKNRTNQFIDKKELTKLEESKKGAKGNFSGVPTRAISTVLIKKIYGTFGTKIKIIGVGGIMSAKDAYEKITSGATMVQLITGIIYEGPQLIYEINYGLVQLLEKDGFKNIEEAVGSRVKNTQGKNKLTT